MNLSKFIVTLWCAILFLTIVFPKVMIGVGSLWLFIGFFNYLLCFRKGRAGWTTAVLFSIAGPISFKVNRSKDPRL